MTLNSAALENPNGTLSRRSLWIAPLLLVFARSAFAFAAQVLVALALLIAGHPSPMAEAAKWWTVYGTLVDVGCLLLIAHLLRRERLRIADLVNLDKKKIGRDLLWGLGLFVLVFPVVMLAGSALASLLVYGSVQPTVPEGIMGRQLPLWGMLYSRSIWWIIWSFTEELTYQGFALPRLMQLAGKKWIAMLIVSVGWALQHSFLPFAGDGKLFLYMFIQFFPLTIVLQLLYQRFKRLPPLIVMHWLMDIAGTFLTIA